MSGSASLNTFLTFLFGNAQGYTGLMLSSLVLCCWRRGDFEKPKSIYVGKISDPKRDLLIQIFHIW